MSIQDDAYNFYIKIGGSPNRAEIHNVVGKLKSSTRGYGNKVSPAPMLGLLLYDQRKLKAFQGRSAVEELEAWSERELQILFGVHNQILRFNERCLAPLVAELPQAINAVNPYKEYPHTVSTEGFEELLFTQEDAEEIIKSFHTHPAFDVALSCLPYLKAQRHSFEYDVTIWQLNSEIVEAGPGGAPKWVTNYEEVRKSKSSNVEVFHHIGALLSLHNSLSNLDQLIYHALFQNELIQLSREHIIDYTMTTNGAGPSMWIMHIPYGLMYIFEPTDLIIVNIDKPETKRGLGDVWCEIHTQILSMGMATPDIITVRMMDENLNAYSYLMR